MATTGSVQIGILSPATPDRPHFKSLENILPPGVSIVHEGLGLLGESYRNLAGKEDAIIDGARGLVKKNKVAGLMLTTEAMVSEIPEEDKAPMPGGMGGMGGGMGM